MDTFGYSTRIGVCVCLPNVRPGRARKRVDPPPSQVRRSLIAVGPSTGERRSLISRSRVLDGFGAGETRRESPRSRRRARCHRSCSRRRKSIGPRRKTRFRGERERERENTVGKSTGGPPSLLPLPVSPAEPAFRREKTRTPGGHRGSGKFSRVSLARRRRRRLRPNRLAAYCRTRNVKARAGLTRASNSRRNQAGKQKRSSLGLSFSVCRSTAILFRLSRASERVQERPGCVSASLSGLRSSARAHGSAGKPELRRHRDIECSKLLPVPRAPPLTVLGPRAPFARGLLPIFPPRENR